MMEKSYYAAFNAYYEALAIRRKRSVAWEAKFTRSGAIAFSCLAAHQEEKLLKAERSLGHKIADAGLARKPCDGLVVYDAICVIPIVFYKPREEEIYEIPLRAFIHERHTCGRKSLTIERARDIGMRIRV